MKSKFVIMVLFAMLVFSSVLGTVAASTPFEHPNFETGIKTVSKNISTKGGLYLPQGYTYIKINSNSEPLKNVFYNGNWTAIFFYNCKEYNTFYDLLNGKYHHPRLAVTLNEYGFYSSVNGTYITVLEPKVSKTTGGNMVTFSQNKNNNKSLIYNGNTEVGESGYTDIETTTSGFYFGGTDWSNTGEDRALYFAAIYNYSLSPSEISQMYNYLNNGTGSPIVNGSVLMLTPSGIDAENSKWVDASGQGNNGTIYGATTIPAAPRTKITIDSGNVILKWNKVQYADYYLIERRVNNNSYEVIGNTTGTQFQDVDIRTYTNYSYQVIAVNNGIRSAVAVEPWAHMYDIINYQQFVFLYSVFMVLFLLAMYMKSLAMDFLYVYTIITLWNYTFIENNLMIVMLAVAILFIVRDMVNILRTGKVNNPL